MLVRLWASWPVLTLTEESDLSDTCISTWNLELEVVAIPVFYQTVILKRSHCSAVSVNALAIDIGHFGCNRVQVIVGGNYRFQTVLAKQKARVAGFKLIHSVKTIRKIFPHKHYYRSRNASYFAFNTGFIRYCNTVFLPVLMCTVEIMPGMIGSFLCVPVKVPLLVRTCTR